MDNIKHIAIIPDGNRRWAKEKGRPAIEGHRYAVENTLPKLFDTVIELGIRYCTFWALSPENFTKRSKQELDHLMFLLRYFINRKMKELHEKNVQIRLIGDITALPSDIQNMLQETLELTKNNNRLTLTFAINYGGRDEIIRAIHKIQSQQISPETVTKETFGNFLDTAGTPDPDLIIRTGGEKRTSGFLPWQSEYAEYAYLDTLFPDFSPELLKQCVNDFLQRHRRFGA